MQSGTDRLLTLPRTHQPLALAPPLAARQVILSFTSNWTPEGGVDYYANATGAARMQLQRLKAESGRTGAGWLQASFCAHPASVVHS